MSSLGNFGRIDYGASMLGQVVEPIKNEFGCEKFVKDDFSEKLGSGTYFILVKRGNCDNPTKVRNIQQIGGSVALIADSHEESLQQLVMEDNTGNTETLTIPGYMIDHDAALEI